MYQRTQVRSLLEEAAGALKSRVCASQVPLVEMHALRNRRFLVVFAGAWAIAGTYRLLM